MNVPSHVTVSGSNRSNLWPVLPLGIKNGVSGQVGHHLFVGLGTAGLGMYALDLDAPEVGWRAIAPFPGPARDSAACAVAGGRLYIASGLGKVTPDDQVARVLQDVYQYDPQRDAWFKLDTGTPVGCLGASAFAIDDNRIGFVGGVNTEIFDRFMRAAATVDPEQEPESGQRILNEFMSMPPEDHKWNAKLWVYSIAENAWSELGDNPYLPNTGAACVAVENGVFLINGEIKPGLRTPQVKRITFQNGMAVWSEENPIPPLVGHPIQDGLAGAYAGRVNGVLLVAGGANFHGSRAVAATGEWYAHRGLQKVWNREVYAKRDGVWHVAGRLPMGLAYGASFEIPEGLLLVGGEDQQQKARTDVHLLTWDDVSGKATCTRLRHSDFRQGQRLGQPICKEI